MRILSVVGARPQFIKLAPIASAVQGRAEHLIVHTGQHYDQMMSDVFFRDLGIPDPDFNLGVGSGKHGAQTAAMLTGLEETIEEAKPDVVLIYGDTNSTLAAALAATKLHVPVAHLEAGLRSFNRRMPEEHNRVLSDHSSDLLLAPTEVAMEHLKSEGLADRSRLVGDVMTDVLFRVRNSLEQRSASLPSGMIPGQFYIATIHRPDNTDIPPRLESILDQLAGLDKPVFLLTHPRLAALAQRSGIEIARGSIVQSAPLAYPDLISAVMHSAGVITDSGGLQKEAFLLRIPCTTIRPETEWVETVDLGWNMLISENLHALAAAVQRPHPQQTMAKPYGDGNAAQRSIDALLELVDR